MVDIPFFMWGVEAGIPKEDFVLAFKNPAIRQHTGYATA
jgi:hypothetical protein